MSTKIRALREAFFDHDTDDDIDAIGERALRILFGDRIGAAIFLGAIAFFSIYWRIGFFSTDNYAVANTLVSVANGHLYVDRIVYGPPSGITPGMHIEGGRLYGRNYGLITAALFVLLMLNGVSVVVDPRIFIVGAWSLAVLGVILFIGIRLDRHREAAVLGSGTALALFSVNTIIATPLSPHWFPLVALQVTTMIAAAMIAVFTYRLLTRIHDRRLGVLAGVAVFIATPVGFWASIPKRHNITTLLVVLTVYCVYRSREAKTLDEAVRFRAMAYAWVGLTAWVHPAEALVLLVAVVPVDLLTARSNRPRQLVIVGGVFLLSVVPFLVTNTLIAGEPFKPPRMLSNYRGQTTLAATEHHDGIVSGGNGIAEGSNPSSNSGRSATNRQARAGTLTRELIEVGQDSVAAVLVGFGFFIDLFVRSINDRLTQPTRLVQVFIRSGYIDGLTAHDERAINLSVLEAMPLAGTLFTTPILVWKRIQRERGFNRETLRSIGRNPAKTADVLAMLILVLFTIMYLGRIPTHHMLTVRYLHPVYPLSIYFIARLEIVRRVTKREWKRLVGSYGCTVLVGIPAYIGALMATDAVLSEAVQLYGSVSVLVGTGVAVWAIGASLTGDRERTGAIMLGIAAATMTVYVVVSGLGFFAFTDEFALPIARAIAESFRPINPLRSLW